MPKEIEETLCETRGNVRGNVGKNVENCRLRGFLRHLVTRFQASSYVDGTTLECQGISIAIPAHLRSKISARSNLAEALDVVCTCQCVKSVQIRNFSGLCFPTFGPEKLRIWTLFTHCVPGFILRYG